MAVKLNLELKVGIFVFIGLVILTMAVFSITEIYIFRPGYDIKVSFNFASGVEVGAVVRVAGITAGEVKDIQLEYDEDTGQAKVMLSIWLDKDVKIARDSQAYVNVLGLIGDRYLEIIPGQDYANLVQEGDILKGRDPLSADTIMEVVYKVGEDFENMLGSVNDVLDEETKSNLQETIGNFREFSASVKVIAGRLERGEGKLGAWLKPNKKRTKK
jgi:phospholipid/cholesterol/gamma-HCH transport system substrate-binding protein